MYTDIKQVQQDMLNLFINVYSILQKHPNYQTNYLEILLRFHKPVKKPALSLFKPNPKLDSVIVPYDQNKGAIRLIKAIETKRAGRVFTDLLSPVAVQNKINRYRFEKIYLDILKRNHIAISDGCTYSNLNKLINYLTSQLS